MSSGREGRHPGSAEVDLVVKIRNTVWFRPRPHHIPRERVAIVTLEFPEPRPTAATDEALIRLLREHEIDAIVESGLLCGREHEATAEYFAYRLPGTLASDNETHEQTLRALEVLHEHFGVPGRVVVSRWLRLWHVR